MFCSWLRTPGYPPLFFSWPFHLVHFSGLNAFHINRLADCIRFVSGSPGVFDFYWPAFCCSSVITFYVTGLVGKPLENNMSERPNNKNDVQSNAGRPWGPKLFIATLVAVLAFFYWLLIYSGGVTVHHG